MTTTRSLLVCAAAMLWATVSACRAEPAALSAEEQAEGFQLLFNGKDLTGWKEVQGKPGSFRVEKGEVIGVRNRETGSAYWLSSDQKYGDFVLRLECMLQKGGNSGVFIRVPGYEGRTSQTGMEIQLRDDGAGKGKPDNGNTGAIYKVVAPSEFAAVPAGKWNNVEIRCDGDNIKVTINGKQVVDAKMSEHEALKNRPREGYIGLSAHTDIARFRNVRLRRLTPTAVNE